MLKAFYYLLLRDMRLALRSRHELANPLIFFVLVVTLFPLAVMPTPERLQEMAPGVIWVAALLSVLLSLDRLFKQDYEDGSLDQLMLSPNPLVVLVLAKVCAHWLLTGLRIRVPVDPVSAVLAAVAACPGVEVIAGASHGIELEFNRGVAGRVARLQDTCPLWLRW